MSSISMWPDRETTTSLGCDQHLELLKLNPWQCYFELWTIPVFEIIFLSLLYLDLGVPMQSVKGEMMSFKAGLASLVILGVSLSACGGSVASSASSKTAKSGASDTTQEAVTTTTKAIDANSLLLSVSDLPSGWSVDNSSQSNTNGSCYSDPLKQIHSNSYAHIDFSKGGGLPELAEEVGVFSSGVQAFKEVTTTLDACKTFTESFQGQGTSGSGTQTAKGTMGEMSSPKYGDQSTAYDATISADGISLNQGFVLVRKGDTLYLVALGDIGSLDTSTLEKIVSLAISKTADNQASSASANASSSQNNATFAKSTTTTSGGAHVGATQLVNDGSGHNFTVTLTSITDPAKPSDQFNTAKTGHRLVAVNLTLTNKSSAVVSDDADADTTVMGSDSQTYESSVDSVSGCTDFASGQFTLTPNSTAKGCVVFDIPSSVKVAKVLFQPAVSNTIAYWLVP